VLLGMRIVGGDFVRVRVVARQVWIWGSPSWFRVIVPPDLRILREKENSFRRAAIGQR